MTNLSSLSKIKLSIFLATLLFVIGFVLKLGDFASAQVSIAIFALGAVFIASSIAYLRKTSKLLKQISDVSKDVRVGNFESRVINLNNEGELRVLSDSVNSAIDICDAFVRESLLAMQAASEGKYYRKIRPEGMQGMFSHSVAGINKAIDFLKNKDEAEKENMRMIELTIKSIDNLVNQASMGIVEEVDIDPQIEGEYRGLIEKMNSLMVTIRSPLVDIMEVLKTLSQGDLTKSISSDYEGIFNEIKTSVNETVEKLLDITTNIKSVSGMVQNSAKEISAASEDLSKRTEGQASTLEETSAAMEQITSTVNETSENSKEAKISSISTRDQAKKGDASVKDLVSAISEISDYSNKISEVISVVDEIAFQTNLLALNASVEAARAGDAGKGFAVVAEEVRALAARCSSSSAEIKELIDTSKKKVQTGESLAGDAGESLETIVNSFSELASKIDSIATASGEQAIGIKEISVAVTDMDMVTQQNAAMVEESSAAAQSLSDLANDLNSLVLFFKTSTIAPIAGIASNDDEYSEDLLDVS